MHLIIGLGNPGRRYRKSRHNVGFTLVDLLAANAAQTFESWSASSLVCRIVLGGREVLLAKPQTYMNRSGIAVRELVREHDLVLSDCLVVYDDVALPLGKIRFRRGGSAGGQKGMQSIIDFLGTVEIPRLRIGIGTESALPDLTGFVLGKFSSSERRTLGEILEASIPAVETFVAEGIERAMARYN